jgi:hypothetical protein
LPPIPGGTARVVWQGVYDACGSVLGAETLSAHAPPRAGHKGLLFDRLDLGVVDPLTGQETPRLAAGASLLGYARNRHHRPDLGRWLQRDPNATGLGLIEDACRYGARWFPGIHAFDLATHCGDGPNPYEYVGSGPWIRGDPLGLYIDDLLIMSYDLAKASSALIGNYAFDMMMDADWALDWSAGDYEFSRFLSPAFEEVDGGDLAAGPVQAGVVTIIRASGRGFREIGGLAGNVARAVYELHHVIPKFLGGLSSGARYALAPGLHRKFHRELADLTRRILGQHPNALAGSDGIRGILTNFDFTRLIEYRREFYELMRRFDAQHGTALVSVFRREFASQRMIRGYEGFFR